jgi:hypothetical protein
MQEGSEVRLLLKRGHKHAHGVKMGGGCTVTHFTIPVDAWDNPIKHGLRPLVHDGVVYPYEQAVRTFLRIAQQYGSTAAALDLLNNVLRNKESE